MGRTQTVERTLGGMPFMTVGRDRYHLLPRLLGAFQIVLAESLHNAEIQNRLDVLRVELQRSLELGQRLVRLVRVIVRHTEVRAGVDVLRRELQRFRVPGDRLVVPLCVEVQVAELHARSGVGRLTFGHRLECPDLRLVQDRGRRGGCLLGLARRLGRPGRRAQCRLLASDDPSGDQSEQQTSDAERDRLWLHGEVMIITRRAEMRKYITCGNAPNAGMHACRNAKQPALHSAFLHLALCIDLAFCILAFCMRRLLSPFCYPPPARTARYSRTTESRPTNSARDMRAWPMDTSSRRGRSRKSIRLWRSRSWPALTPRQRDAASPADSAYTAKERRASRAPRSNARANGSVYSSTRSAPLEAANRMASGRGSTKRLTRMPPDFNALIASGNRSSARPSVQPAWLVISPGATGTRVHWSGRTSSTSSRRSGRGSPSMLYSIAGRRLSSARATSRTSSG